MVDFKSYALSHKSDKNIDKRVPFCFGTYNINIIMIFPE